MDLVTLNRGQMTTTKPEQQLSSPSFNTTPRGGCLTPCVCGGQNTPRFCSGIRFQVWKTSRSKSWHLTTRPPKPAEIREIKRNAYHSLCPLISPNSRSHKHRH
ncbi:hypothetical protein AVEN_43495-1 [Araneus ventricosus]|uniref:Uncharacterized protein n=1 Tax=Araneus ventricosus TaxID=182803 RepID=A0A4Y2RYD7_ARAVE|nr:hypothetical protein AVEN_43495-1 [Araneus ventricosus]